MTSPQYADAGAMPVGDAAEWLHAAVRDGGALDQLSHMIDEIGIRCAPALPTQVRGTVTNACIEAHFDINRLQVRLGELRKALTTVPTDPPSMSQPAVSDRVVAARSGTTLRGSGPLSHAVPAAKPAPAPPAARPRH